MNEKNAREALHLIFERQAHVKDEGYETSAHEPLVDVQISKILEKGNGFWDSAVAENHIHDFQFLFKEIGE